MDYSGNSCEHIRLTTGILDHKSGIPQVTSTTLVALDYSRLPYTTIASKAHVWGSRWANGSWSGVLGDLGTNKTDMTLPAFAPIETRVENLNYLTTVIHWTRLVFLLNKQHFYPTTRLKWWKVFPLIIWITIMPAFFVFNNSNDLFLLPVLQSGCRHRALVVFKIVLLLYQTHLTGLFGSAILIARIKKPVAPFSSLHGAAKGMLINNYKLVIPAARLNSALMDKMKSDPIVSNALQRRPPIVLRTLKDVIETVAHTDRPNMKLFASSHADQANTILFKMQNTQSVVQVPYTKEFPTLSFVSNQLSKRCRTQLEIGLLLSVENGHLKYFKSRILYSMLSIRHLSFKSENRIHAGELLELWLLWLVGMLSSGLWISVRKWNPFLVGRRSFRLIAH